MSREEIPLERPFWAHSPVNKPGKKTWLTERRRADVAKLYEWGLRDAEAISDEMGLSPRTVRKYLRELERDRVNVNMLGAQWTWAVLDRYGPGDVSTVAHNLNVLRSRGKLSVELPLYLLAEECALTRKATEAALIELETARLIHRNSDRVTIIPG